MPRLTDEPRPAESIEWGDFKLAMLQDAAYQRVCDRTSNQRAVSRIESYFTAEIENWPIAAMLWAQMIHGCIEEIWPSVAEVEAWRVIAEDCSMPIEFDEYGFLQVPTDDS